MERLNETMGQISVTDSAFPKFSADQLLELEKIYNEMGENSLDQNLCREIAENFSARNQTSLSWEQVHLWFRNKLDESQDQVASASPDEPDKKNPTKLKRGGSSYTCSRCHQKGHNQRKCPLPPPLDDEHIEEKNESQREDLSQVFGAPSTQDVPASPPSTQEAPPPPLPVQPAARSKPTARGRQQTTTSQPPATSRAKKQAPPPPQPVVASRAKNQAPTPPPPQPAAASRARHQAPPPPQPAVVAREKHQGEPAARSASQPKKPAAQPKKPAAQPKKPVAAAPNQRGKKRGADNEIGHSIPGENASGSNGAAGKGDKGKATVASHDQGKKRLIKKRWI